MGRAEMSVRRSLGGLNALRRLCLALVAGATLALLVGLLASSFRGANAEELVAPSPQAATYYLSISDTNTAPCTSYDTANSRLNINTNPGSLSSNCLTLSISTDNPSGYTLSIHGTNPANLTHTTIPTETIVPKAGSIAIPSTFSTAQGSSWGFAVPLCQLYGTINNPICPVGGWPGDLNIGFDRSYAILGSTNTTNTNRYAPVPTTDTVISKTDRVFAATHNYNIYFATLTASNKAGGAYKGTVTFTAQTNVIPPPPDIQTITAENCPTTRTMVRDARDDHTYWIRKIPNTRPDGGDLCWMETNLAYAGGTTPEGSNQYGDVINDLVEGSAANGNIAAGQACYGDNTTMNANKTKCYWIPNNANPTAGDQTPSENTSGSGQLGYLYNWCAAMNGQAEACQTTADSQPKNQQANPGNGTMYNICPAGWRLPTGDDPEGEFTKLNDAINGGATNSPNGLLAQGLYMYSGYWGNGRFNNSASGREHRYSSSTVGNITGARNLAFGRYTGGVDPADTSLKGYGAAVRCVAGDLLTTPAPPGADMQQIRGTVPTVPTDTIKYYCPTTRTRARDARDGHTYWIRKIPNTRSFGGEGDLCWMETNLSYAGDGSDDNSYGDVIPDLVQGSAANGNIASGQACYGNNNTMDANKAKCYWISDGANPTAGVDDPVLSYSGSGQYGYLYNWCAAMNGQAEACQDSAASQPNQRVNPGNGTMYNICPVGWRLPAGGGAGSEFNKLYTALSAEGGSGGRFLQHNGLYKYSGYWQEGSFRSQTARGDYWSSTIRSGPLAYNLEVTDSSANSADSNSKGYGLAVRCVNSN